MTFKIVWKSCSQWVGTECETNVEDEIFATREAAEKRLAELELDGGYMTEVQDAAIEAQGVEGWIEIEECGD